MIKEWMERRKTKKFVRRMQAQLSWYIDTAPGVVDLAPDNLSAAVLRAKERTDWL